MVGIRSYGAYVPNARLSSETRNWTGKHDRAVADFDEDVVTMAVAAASDCLNGTDRSTVDALFLASTSAPYAEKQSSSIVATATEMPDSVFTADVSHSLRSSTQALRLALDSVAAGTFKQALVVASDCRPAAPGSPSETEGGDAAAALLITNDNPIAEVTASYSYLNEINDVWRADGESLLRIADEHFRFEDGYLHSVEHAVKGLLEQTGLKVSDFDRVVLYAPDARRLTQAISTIGATKEQTNAGDLLQSIGSTGTSFALLQLTAALEGAGPGKRILLVGYGDGADAYVLQTTDAAGTFAHSDHRGVNGYLRSARPVSDYYDFLRWRGMIVDGPSLDKGAAPAAHSVWRDKDKTLRFRGMRCTACSRVQWPPQRVCVHCRARDEAEPVSLSQDGGTVFTYSQDHVARTPDKPLVHAVIDFDLGARAMMMMGDRPAEQVAIGMRVEPAFRKFHSADGVHTYQWKVIPARNGNS